MYIEIPVSFGQISWESSQSIKYCVLHTPGIQAADLEVIYMGGDRTLLAMHFLVEYTMIIWILEESHG